MVRRLRYYPSHYMHPWGDHKDVLEEQHELLDCWMAFLTAERSEEQLQTLLKSWSECVCDECDEWSDERFTLIHQIAKGAHYHRIETQMLNPPPHSAAAFFAYLSWRISETGAFIDTVDLVQGLTPNRWPGTLERLMPYGPETTEKSLIILAQKCDTERVLETLWLTTRVSGPALRQAMLSSQLTFNHFCSTSRTIVNAVAEAGTSKSLRDKALDRLTSFVRCMSEYVAFLSETLGCDMETLTGYDWTIMFISTSEVLRVLEEGPAPLKDKPELSTQFDEWRSWAVALWTISNVIAERNGQPNFEQIPYLKPSNLSPILASRVKESLKKSSGDLSREEERFGAAKTIIVAAVHIRRSNLCYAPGCNQSLQTAGRSFQRFSGCRIVTYCSPTCQLLAWKSSDPNLPPHKGVCSKIRRILEIGCEIDESKNSVAEYAKLLLAQKPSAKLLKEVGDWLEAAFTRNMHESGMVRQRGSPSS